MRAHALKHESDSSRLFKASLKEIRTVVIPAVIPGGQGAPHGSAAGRVFTSREMQHYSREKIQRREVDARPSLSLSNGAFEACSTAADSEISTVMLSASPSSPFRYPELAAVCRDSRTLILYPGPKSENLEELVQREEIGTEKHNVIIIDGTWSQAKNMFLKNSLLHLPKQVHRRGAI